MNHQQFQQLLDRDNANMGASEAHGCLWGLFCGEKDRKKFDWKVAMAPLLDDENQSVSVDLSQCIERYSQQIGQQLEDGMFETPLLIPVDEQPIALRLEGLANWCDGWLLGFGLSQSDNHKLSEEGREALTDVRDIAQVDYQIEEGLSEDEREDMEKDFLELCEHIKIAVQIIQSDIAFTVISKSVIQNSPSLH